MMQAMQKGQIQNPLINTVIATRVNITISKRVIIFALAAMMLSLVSCNSKSEESEELVISSTTAVTSFSLKANASILENLDSVFFSIDLDHRVIFNADSLPLGTPVDKLIAVIKFPDSVKEAKVAMYGGGKEESSFDYKSHPTDTIDFTRIVYLEMTAQDGVTKNSYRVKVNVHQTEPDSLIWDKIALSKLPSRLGTPKEQKSVERDGTVFTLLRESDGTLTLASSEDIYTGRWEKRALTLPFQPRIETFSAVGSDFYMLSSDGLLMKSADAGNWESTGEIWRNIIGSFNNSLIGLAMKDDALWHVSYPAGKSMRAADDFPVEGFSSMVSFTSRWSDTPVGIITGGRCSDSHLTGATWGYDGNSWAVLSDALPPGEGVALIPYFSYRKTAALWLQTEYSVLMAIGGRGADGSVSKTLYLSYDNGINWQRGSTLLQLPEYIPPFAAADALVVSTRKEGSLADSWREQPDGKPSAARINYQIDGYDVIWDCPYIYLLGGYGTDGKLYDAVWRGVLGRLTFMPVI